ncbi:hypothetical protein EDD22DRAFT_962338 [Suillus occidentalis]|nr:hypothetical protein EDD22DRAFT_962338 [Suillus occidentalis]
MISHAHNEPEAAWIGFPSITSSQSDTEGEDGWFGKGGRLWLDRLPWYNYLAFGSPFGMTRTLQLLLRVATLGSSSSLGGKAVKTLAGLTVTAVANRELHGYGYHWGTGTGLR